MRILLDLQGAQTTSRLRGIGRYSLSLAQAIARKRGDHEVIIALNGLFPDSIDYIREAFCGILPQENIHVWHAAGPVNADDERNGWRQHAAELARESFIASLRPDIVHISSAFEGFREQAVVSVGAFEKSIPVAATFYDVIPLIYREQYLAPQPSFEAFYRKRLETIKKADYLLSISDSARQEAIQYLGIRPERAVNIGAAADAMFRKIIISASDERHLRRRLGLSRPFVLYVTAPDARKNHFRLVGAFARLPAELRKKNQLVIAGNLTDDAQRKLKKMAMDSGLSRGDLVLAGRMADEDMVRLYNLCKLFVFPSWHEGFGLPALEAMSCGAPVIASDSSSLPEVVGREDALFSPFDETSIAQKMQHVLTDDAFRDELSRHGLEQAGKFSWDRSAACAISSFEQWHAARRREIGVPADPADRAPQPHLVRLMAKHSSRPGEGDVLATAEAMAKNFPRTGDRHLLVDISQIAQGDARTGIQRVVRAVLTGLLQAPPAGWRVEPVYATPDRQGYRYARKFIHRFLDRNGAAPEDEVVDVAPGDVFLGLDLQSHAIEGQRDVLLDWRRRGVRVQFVVYDLLPIRFPRFFTPGVAEAHERWCRTISLFDGVACISRTVADEFHDWMESRASRDKRPFAINWFHLGADLGSSMPSMGLPEGAVEMLQTLAAHPSFLMVSTIEPRKGHAQVLKAFELLWKRGVEANLVIVGKQGWMVRSLAARLRGHPQNGKRLFWLEGVSDAYLEQVYGACACLIAASEGEGFGLPLIEAAHHKLPVIARDIPVFREVAGSHAFYFSGDRPDALASAIQDWLALQNAGNAPASAGMPWQTWEQSTRQLIEAVLGGNAYRIWTPREDHAAPGAETLRKAS